MTRGGILEPGDIVVAVRDGWPGSHLVPKGTRGTVKQVSDAIYVEWDCARGFALASDAFVEAEIVAWFEGLRADPVERARMDRVVERALAERTGP